jgi:hypothetical protein
MMIDISGQAEIATPKMNEKLLELPLQGPLELLRRCAVGAGGLDGSGSGSWSWSLGGARSCWLCCNVNKPSMRRVPHQQLRLTALGSLEQSRAEQSRAKQDRVWLANLPVSNHEEMEKAKAKIMAPAKARLSQLPVRTMVKLSWQDLGDPMP